MNGRLDIYQNNIREPTCRGFVSLLYDEVGITLLGDKKSLVTARLSQRIAKLGLASDEDYLRLLSAPGNELERQFVIDALTTNGTRFFREQQHFDFLTQHLGCLEGGQINVWSAACSSGQEPYTIAMVLSQLNRSRRWYGQWRILASDVNQQVLHTARLGREKCIGSDLDGDGGRRDGGHVGDDQNGAVTIAQDEASCVVYGVPKMALQRGGVDHVAPLASIAPMLLSLSR